MVQKVSVYTEGAMQSRKIGVAVVAAGLVVALLHDGELIDEVPAEAHDVRVYAVALPGGLVRL